jgi:hypothetical protein
MPIPKGGVMNDISDFQPIYLLPILSKVLQRCIYDQFINCKTFNLGFSGGGHSCCIFMKLGNRLTKVSKLIFFYQKLLKKLIISFYSSD